MKRRQTDVEKVTLLLDADALEGRGQFRGSRSGPRGIELDDMLLVEDDAPGIGRPHGEEERSWFEHLHSAVRLKKRLVLDDGRARAARLVLNGIEKDDNDEPLHISINGHELIRPPSKIAHPFARQYYTSDWGSSNFDNWFVVELPVGSLKSGVNEIEMWADSSETTWEIMVAAGSEFARGSEERQQHPDRSAKSVDGGLTWDWERLGWQNRIDGEYCVRLSLDRYVTEGEYLSPVIDLAEAPTVLRRRLEIQHCRAEWTAQIPHGCALEIPTRLGESPLPDADSWSDFSALDGVTQEWRQPHGRYMQFRAVLSTEDPLVTPVLESLSITTMLDVPIDESHVDCRVFKIDNGRVERPSRAFVHEDYNRLAGLRERFGLDRVVAGATTEFEAQLLLMEWAYKIPIGKLDPYCWSYDDLPQLDDDGRATLQAEYGSRRRDGHCLFCNLTLIGACLAMGYPARWVNISTKHTYGHEVAEVWSNDFNKWIFLDATRDYYIYDPDTGVPLNLVEISGRLAQIMPGPATWEHPIQWHLPDESVLSEVRVAYREGKSRHSISDLTEGISNLLLFKGHLQMPLRNDFASRPHPVPWRVSSNWGSDQFYCFYSEMFPRKHEYHHHTSRRQDFNPALNQAELHLQQTSEPHVVHVEVDTETPGFDAFLVQVDDGEWSPKRHATLQWFLHEGFNQLRVTARNKMGICGPISHVSIVMNS